MLDNEDVDVNNFSHPVNIQPGRHPGSPLSVTDQLVLASEKNHGPPMCSRPFKTSTAEKIIENV